MPRKAKKGVSEADREAITAVFEQYEEDGRISAKAVGPAMAALGVQLSAADERNLLKLIDGDLGLDGFIDVCSLKLREDKDEVGRAFALFDKEGTGRITIEDLRRVAQELGEEISDEDLMDMLEEANRHRETRHDVLSQGISQHDFGQILSRAGVF
jgi:Ca2+-binding EF-hand superfamily protein